MPALALGHVDMMFHVFCELGYGVGLDAAARGMGIAGKDQGHEWRDAPVLWAEGTAGGSAALRRPGRADHAESGNDLRGVRRPPWIARSGKMRTMPLPRGGWR